MIAITASLVTAVATTAMATTMVAPHAARAAKAVGGVARQAWQTGVKAGNIINTKAAAIAAAIRKPVVKPAPTQETPAVAQPA